jgi:hypothetical protein
MLLSLLIAFGIYLAVGVAYKRSQGYRGMEQMPHYEGWSALFERVRNWRGTGGAGAGYRQPGGVGDYRITLVDDDELFSE